MSNARKVVENWFDAIEARDVDRIIGMLDENVTIETESFTRPMRGRDKLPGLMQAMMGNYRSIRIGRETIVAADPQVAVLARVQAEMASDIELAGETLPTAGRSIDVTGAIFLEVNEGRITKVRRVQDLMGIIRQLDLSPDQMHRLMQTLERQLLEPPSREAA